MLSGVINVDKPAGMTSHDVVARVRRIAGQKKVGHAGTLDPDATGVLLVCLGHATRISDLLAEQGKCYRAVLALGATTSTEDASGTIIEEHDASSITRDALIEVTERFIGEVDQIPPMVSAVHHEGQRLYDLARKGIVVERAARRVRFDAIAVLDFTPGERAAATLDVACGKGAYIRTLCADIGAALGAGGHMASLRRTRVGRFETESESSVTLERLQEDGAAAHIVRPSDAVSFLPERRIETREIADLFNGKDLPAGPGASPGALVRLTDDDDELLALATVTADGARVHPDKVFKRE
ncbi:MAG: tRNA pseudouridine(55) synthase TruB [Capsulimonadaceae bacterium]|nr:tRNA pseudouridine(55) synthase TruB [Capsulimonadaceae bacterium]